MLGHQECGRYSSRTFALCSRYAMLHRPKHFLLSMFCKRQQENHVAPAECL